MTFREYCVTLNPRTTSFRKTVFEIVLFHTIRTRER